MPTAAIAPLTNAAPTSDALAAVTEHIAIIKQNYRASDWQRVERYLQDDPLSAGLLVEAKRHIKGVFGGAVEVFLDVTPDPSGADHPFLYARILTTETRREASRKLRLFDEEWWLDAGSRVDARLEFTVSTPIVEGTAVAIWLAGLLCSGERTRRTRGRGSITERDKPRLLCRFLQRTDQSNAARPGLDQGRGARLA